MAKINIDWFLISLFGAVAASFFIPSIGANGGPLYLDHFAKWGVFVIFFLHGAKLSISQIKAGLGAIKLHITAQTIVFIIFPIFGALIYFATNGILNPSQRLGIVFLCAISSTISSSIVLTSMAGGNISGTIFSATISGILGIFLTPFIISFFYGHSGQIDPIEAIIEIAKLLFVPFVLGQVLRPLIGKLLERFKLFVANLDRAIIVLIVFVAFCNSNQAKIFSAIPLSSLFAIIAIIIVLFVLSISASGFIAKAVGLDKSDKISAVFVGATKSLANGVPIAGVLFAHDPNIGVIILPLMLYHPLQLAACAWLARKWSIQAPKLVGIEVKPNKK